MFRLHWLALTLFSAAPLWACTGCFGDPSSKSGRAVMWGIFFLLGVITSVLAVIAITAYRWAKRSQKLAAAAPNGEL